MNTSPGTGLDIPFESQNPRAPESFKEADLQAASRKQSTVQETKSGTDGGRPGKQHPQSAASDSAHEGPAQQQSTSPDADSGEQVSSLLLSLPCHNRRSPCSGPDLPIWRPSPEMST